MTDGRHRASHAASIVARPLHRLNVALKTRRWAPHSRLFVVGEGSGWSVDEDAATLTETTEALGVAVGPADWARFARNQVVFHTSQFAAVGEEWLRSSHRLGMAYLHGRPGTAGYPEFDRVFDTLRADPGRFERIQVTHSEMEELVLEAGVDATRVFQIPIGIDLASFPLADDRSREAARAALGLPRTAFVVGSFQKDGVGWDEGLEPKLIKGPDVLVAALALARERIPELAVLLTAPARGYVLSELDARGIPYWHVVATGRDELARAYRALDAYVVASRQEGGPKAVLESMASGVPLVTTRVGQAVEMVRDGENGWLVDVDDANGLAAGLARVAAYPAKSLALVRLDGRATAETFSHEALLSRWAALFDGFVSIGATE